MSIYVFIGPTLPVKEARRYLKANYLPPVSQGDIVSLLKERPRVIGIIDGYFENVPSVWHKEILLAISMGIHVIGASSMGALRAAELHQFGMVGIGEIFRWYSKGIIEADDEVAVAHAAEEHDYRPASEAMVNIRKTLLTAREKGLISPSTEKSLILKGKAIPYYDRTYHRILSEGSLNGIPEKEISALREYAASNAVDQKRLDSIEALKYINRIGLEDEPPKIDFQIQQTVYLEHLVNHRQPVSLKGKINITSEDLIRSAAIELDDFISIRDRAVTNRIICSYARFLGIQVTAEEMQDTADEFRTSLGIHSEVDTYRWLEKNDMTEDDFGELIEEIALMRKVRSLALDDLLKSLLNQLRLEGKYEEVKAISMELKKFLNSQHEGIGQIPDNDQICKYYFTSKGLQVPDSLLRYASILGFEDETSFIDALRTYYMFHAATQPQSCSEDNKQQR